MTVGAMCIIDEVHNKAWCIYIITCSDGSNPYEERHLNQGVTMRVSDHWTSARPRHLVTRFPGTLKDWIRDGMGIQGSCPCDSHGAFRRFNCCWRMGLLMATSC